MCCVSAELCWEPVSGWSEVLPASCCHIPLYVSSVCGTLDFRKILLLLSFPVRSLQEFQVFCQAYCCELSVSICQSCRLLILVFLLIVKDFFSSKAVHSVTSVQSRHLYWMPNLPSSAVCEKKRTQPLHHVLRFTELAVYLQNKQFCTTIFQ